MVFAKQNIKKDEIFGSEMVRVYKIVCADIVWDEILHQTVRRINSACLTPIINIILK